MRLQISKSSNSKHFYAIKTVKIEGKETTKVVAKLGSEDEIKEKYGVEDAEQWARDRVAEMTRLEKQDIIEVMPRFKNSKRIPKNVQTRFNGGYLFLQQIYEQLDLQKITEKIASKYKFKYDLDDILRKLVFTRILYPSSKKSSVELSQRFLEQPEFKLHQVYRALEVFAKESDFLQSELYKASKKAFGRNDKILFYDCTNYFFEIEEAEGLKQYGQSKESRPNPIVQMGLFMDADGFPLAFSLHPGNQNEQVTLRPLESKILKDFELSKFIVCTDAGLSSKANREFNNRGDRAYVTVQSLKKLPKHLKDWALSAEGWELPGSDEVFNLGELDEDKYYNDTFYKSRWMHEGELEQKLFVSYSPKYKNYMRQLRKEQLDRAANMVATPAKAQKTRPNDPKRFIQEERLTGDGEVAEQKFYYIDQEKVTEEERFDGFYAVCTNLEADAQDIIHINKGRWQIEQCFRILKTEFKARPVYLSRDDRITAHFLTCFIALLIYRILEKKVNSEIKDPKQKICGSKHVETLREMDFYEIRGEGYVPLYTRTDLTDLLHKAFGFRTDTQVVSLKTMNKIMRKTRKK